MGGVSGRLGAVVSAVALAVSATGAAGSSSSHSPGALVFASDAGIYVSNLDGTGLARLTTGEFDGNAAWSPDGKEIAFTDDVVANGSIFVMKADGGDKRRLGWAENVPPAWSPDG